MQQEVSTLARSNGGYETMLNKDHDWIYPDMGCMMHILAHAWSWPQSAAHDDAAVWQQMLRFRQGSA